MATEKPFSSTDDAAVKTEPIVEVSKEPASIEALQVSDDNGSTTSDAGQAVHVPRRIKITAVLIVALIGFGSHWSSGVSGAMKSTLKKELRINNTQYALLEASQDFMVTALILFTGILTDRIGGAGAMVWGNVIYSLGSIIIAAATTVRSYKLMIGGIVIQSFGDIATQVAQYRVFSSWFAPSNGFAATLGFELGMGKLGGFIGKASANPIAKRTGNFAWVYWTAVLMNLFTNAATILFWKFRKYTEKHYPDGLRDPSTGEILKENSKKFEFRKVLELPWAFWTILSFSLFQTSTAAVFNANATELAEKRFHVSAIKAGWYTSLSQYLGFFLVPLLGVFIDLFGNRVTVMAFCGTGMFISMVLAAFGPSISGTAASLGVYAVAVSLGPTVIIDAIRTSIWHQDTFGAAYSIKILINNSMNIIVRVVTGVIQDRDNDSYDQVVYVYVVQAAGAVVVAALLLTGSWMRVDLKRLQWTKKERLRKGDVINELRKDYEEGLSKEKHRLFGKVMFSGLFVFMLGGWCAFFWGVATGNNQ
ncbi:major facilitator superfamily transporter like protein [Zymoseptoria brevis]|uniref:Lysosomal dipeptide transporter MFSD1 n=1 Tax=Zymoseptoria brevis TaxID=1047168 RepID=A0A0F4GEW6_9PEZI|nr:major facilitator superfamily transporter like protein [Zymoseptoria brevis]